MVETMTPARRAVSSLRDSGYAGGGAVHSDAAQDKAQIKKLIGTARIKLKGGGAVSGGAAKSRPDRRDRGGGVGPDTNEMTLKGGGADPDRAPGKTGLIYTKRDAAIENNVDDIEAGRAKARRDMMMDRPDRRARGGAMKHKPHIGAVNIVVANGKPSVPPQPMPVPVPARPQMPMAGPPPGAGMVPAAIPGRPGGPPMGAPPMAPPPAGMMRPPGAARGGAVHRARGGGVDRPGFVLDNDKPETNDEDEKMPFSDAQDMEKLEKARDAKGRFMGGAV